MNHPKEVKELNNQNDRKIKLLKTGEISSKFPGKQGGISRHIRKMLLAKMDL